MGYNNCKIKEAQQKIDNMSAEDFNGSEKSYGIDYKKPLETPPVTSEQAYAARHLAMVLSFKDNYLKALWQRYWLSCCLSSKCDFVFAELNAININREKDIITIWEKGNIWEYIGSNFGKAFYHDICQKFLLRRYAWWYSCKIWFKYNRKSFAFFNLLLPRLLGTILIGFLVLTTSEEMWLFPSKIYIGDKMLYFTLLIIGVFVSWLYLFIECRNINGKISFLTILGRSSWVLFIGAVYSLIISNFIIVPVFGTYIVGEYVTCFQTKLLFSSLALFIGIFIQIFWEEKTITEPL